MGGDMEAILVDLRFCCMSVPSSANTGWTTVLRKPLFDTHPRLPTSYYPKLSD